MFELRLGAARDYLTLAPGWATHVVSIADPGPAAVPRLAPRFVFVRFEDTERRSVDGPTREHVEEILDFSRELRSDDRLLIHATAGFNRAAAVAVAILVQHDVAVDEALQRIDTLCKGATPNRLICAYADEVLGTGGRIGAALALRNREGKSPLKGDASRGKRLFA
jgi:predicted protein tyrosine phosphatase